MPARRTTAQTGRTMRRQSGPDGLSTRNQLLTVASEPVQPKAIPDLADAEPMQGVELAAGNCSEESPLPNACAVGQS